MKPRHFQAVAVVAGESGHVVRLAHRDRGLTLDIAELALSTDAAEYCDRLADFLSLPTLFLAGRPAEAVALPAQARRSFGAKRRPRFLARRKTGLSDKPARVVGREMIARH